MSLIEIWKETPSSLRNKRVEQIIGIAGDGNLGDSNSAPEEFRAFLAQIPRDILSQYANDCLENSFKDSGLALQDIVNEIANRLGFDVEAGRYRGTKKDIGHDGIWTGPDGHSIVAEVKTTDAYRLSVETIAGYRDRLIESSRIGEDTSSILVIVGREDTGGLEAQIRGSRHAWDVRLISIDSLIRLMQIRQELESPVAEAQIRMLLVPREYTRVDGIIDLVFSTTEDILEEDSDEPEKDGLNHSAEPKKRGTPVAFNAACAARISTHLGVDLVRQSRVVFSDPSAGLTITCAVSKESTRSKNASYLFAFHPHQLDKLSHKERAFASFGCGSADQIALLPLSFLKSQLNGMNQTCLEDGSTHHWHVKICRRKDGWILRRRKDENHPNITDMMLLT